MTVKDPRLYLNVWSEGSRKKCPNNIKLEAMGFAFILHVCKHTQLYYVFLHLYTYILNPHNQDSVYNDSPDMDVLLEEAFPRNVETITIINKTLFLNQSLWRALTFRATWHVETLLWSMYITNEKN
jgi:hypothetical protein